jgi:tol-pal system protein YbgF
VRRLLLTSALSVLVLVGVVPGAALAQSDSRALYDRLDRMERDMTILQQQQARGGSTVIRSPAIGGGVVSSSSSPDLPLAGGQASRLEDRINELEDLARHLTGKLEEANFKSAQLAKQIERMQADIDLRFKELQEGGRGAQGASAASPSTLSMPGPSPAASVPPAPASTAAGAPVLIPPRGAVSPGANAASGTGPAPGPALLGQMSDKDLRKVQTPAAAAAPAAPKDPQSAYDEAFGLAQKGEYEGAERAFKDFLKAYPNHGLAGNAQYWLGDIAFSQKDYPTAATTFLEAYKKYSKHGKAPDMIYKAGVSLAQMGKTKEACTAMAILYKDHPEMPDRIKRAASADRQRLGCN